MEEKASLKIQPQVLSPGLCTLEKAKRQQQRGANEHRNVGMQREQLSRLPPGKALLPVQTFPWPLWTLCLSLAVCDCVPVCTGQVSSKSSAASPLPCCRSCALLEAFLLSLKLLPKNLRLTEWFWLRVFEVTESSHYLTLHHISASSSTSRDGIQAPPWAGCCSG